MTDRLTRLLSEREWLLSDGATGTSLFDMGLEAGDAPELWNVDRPDSIRALYQGWVEAGADLFLTNTFGGNASRLGLFGAQGRVAELNRVGAALAREVADASGREIVVAGSMGPTGEILEPMGPLGYDAAVEIFREQAVALRDGGVDILWVETLSALEEFRAVAEAIASVGMPWCVTMSFDTAGRTMMGVTPADFVRAVEGVDHRPVAFGANCGTGASDLLRTILGLVAQVPELPLIAKGNAGIPRFVEGQAYYDGTPELMATYARLARDCGARIIGGCCGTSPEHLTHMRRALETHAPRTRPGLDDIVDALGGFSSTGNSSDGLPPVRARPRRV